jgi:kinesin family protein 5
MRAKSIKNKARVNVEMSPNELKALLKKTVAELASVREHAAALEEEVKQWRSGGRVDKESWAAPMATPSAASTLASRKFASPAPPQTPGSTSSISRAGTPGGIWSAIESRPDTPTATMSVMSHDEREDFLKRENELSDQLAEKVSYILLLVRPS